MLTILGLGRQESSLKEVLEMPKVANPQSRPGKKKWRMAVRHGDLVETILADFDARGWSCPNKTFFVSPNKAEMAASFDLRLPAPSRLPVPGCVWGFGVVNSNTGRKALRFYTGVTIVKDNGVGVPLYEVHKVTHIDAKKELDDQVQEAVGKFEESLESSYKDIGELKQEMIGGDEATLILAQAARQRLMPWSWIGVVDRAFRFRTRTEKHFPPSAWNLLLLFADVAKRNNPLSQMAQVSGFRGLLPVKLPA